MAQRPDRPPRFAIGCLLLFPGFFGGGMIGALVARIVTSFRRCVPPEGFPACDIWMFVLPASVIGGLTLSTVVIWRLRRRDDAAGNLERS